MQEHKPIDEIAVIRIFLVNPFLVNTIRVVTIFIGIGLVKKIFIFNLFLYLARSFP